MRLIYPENLEDIVLGAAVLGGGGGSDPYVAKLMGIDALRTCGPVQGGGFGDDRSTNRDGREVAERHGGRRPIADEKGNASIIDAMNNRWTD